MRERPLLFDLAQLLEAGLAPADAVDRIRADGATTDPAFTRLRTDLKRGRSLAAAVHDAGFSSRLETEILKTAEGVGKLSEALRLVAANCERRRSRAARLRMRLWLPNVVLFIALGIRVVRGATAGASLPAELFGAAMIALAALVLSRALVAALVQDATRWLSFGWRLGLQRMSKLYRRFFEHIFYTLFVWQADGGLDYVSAAQTLRSLIPAPGYQTAVGHYKQALSRGDAVADALTGAGLLMPGELAEVVNVGEQSGRLVPALRHYLTLEDDRLDQVSEAIFTWLPRLYYVVVLLLGAAFVI